MIGYLEDTNEDVIEALLFQFAYRAEKDGRLVLCTGGLSALEAGFEAAGWDDPHQIPELECETDGCHREATCGVPTPSGYKRLCGDHYRAIEPPGEQKRTDEL
jgi:hypothetical protein